MKNEEHLIRVAKLFGNGAHVFVPKEWIGEQIVLIREKKSLKEKILSVLDPYLEFIVGIYIYGSYVRNEQTKDSDIDLFVLSNKKIKIKAEGFEILCLRQEEIEKAIKLEPVLMYSILSEAKPIINSKLLDELKIRYKPKLSDFKEFLKDCKRIITINEEFLELEKGEYISGNAIIYSLILRLRGIFIIKSFLRGQIYSHKFFKNWIKNKLPQIDFDNVYEAYRNSKNEQVFKQKIRINDIKLLLNYLKNEVFMLNG